jgi:Bacterial PH domain
VFGQEKTPVSWAAVRGSRVDAGCYARQEASAASTRFPITTSNARVCITVDGSLRTGHRSNSRNRRDGHIPAECEDDGVHADSDQTPVVIRISPMAHFAVGFFALGLLALVLAQPSWFALLFVIPVVLSAFIVRYRTTADRDSVTARTLLASQTVSWDDIAGLRFDKGSWASAQLKDGGELRLPAVTFVTLPLLTEASGGRVPNPYTQGG